MWMIISVSTVQKNLICYIRLVDLHLKWQVTKKKKLKVLGWVPDPSLLVWVLGHKIILSGYPLTRLRKAEYFFDKYCNPSAFQHP